MAGIVDRGRGALAELEPDTFDARLFAYNESDACSSRFGALVDRGARRVRRSAYVPTDPVASRARGFETGRRALRGDARGFANVYVVGTGVSSDRGDASKHKAVAHFTFENADPGYKGTAALAVEAALCLALPTERAKTPGSKRGGGVLTPAAALGSTLVDRIERDRRAGLGRETAGGDGVCRALERETQKTTERDRETERRSCEHV